MAERRLRVFAPLRIEARAARRGASSAVVTRTGMGAKRSRRAAALFTQDSDAHAFAILGLCGALHSEFEPGTIVIANEVRTASTRDVIELPGADLLASDLSDRGLPVHVGPLVTSDRLVTRARRRELAASGATAVDMETAVLLSQWQHDGAPRPVAVARIVLDSPDHELGSLATLRNLGSVQRRMTEVVPSLERWADCVAPRRIVLAGPRSFCAGVERAIDIVERALDRFGAPVYVRRQVVHNTHVVRRLEERGAIFVHEADEVPDGSTLILAAHGVAPTVRQEVESRPLRVIDATCPLVAKVHTEARKFAERDYDIVLIGHHDHEEIEGTFGEAPDRIKVIASANDVGEIEVRNPDRVAFLTQTTLATDAVSEVIAKLRTRFPNVVAPRSEDICYATQNRQDAISAVAAEADVVFVVGSTNSSNSRRLVEVVERKGVRAHLIDDVRDIELDWVRGSGTIGITAGASAPESKVQETVDFLRSLGPVTVEERIVREESVSFSLPPAVR